MEQILKQRQIDRLYHFTQAENLPNIFSYGLLPREILEDNNIHSCFNDDYRYDDCLNAVCTSIEFPNYKMFYKLRQDDLDVDWVVLRLNAQILCDYQCAYCWTNAGNSTMYNTPINERMGTDAFLELFENRPNYPKREELSIKKWYPTNPQAEVLVFGEIPISYIDNVYFENTRILARYKNTIPNGIEAGVNNTVFRYREDWDFW
ncbi:MAG: DarT ssDNA thymidine ADP-ribosyltransferase family protein [Lacrimispora sp.]|uniref:DarT ssDNA thymidine ADP-ribosyltransferase family protein n=1 Tax=Lacrimispora sp. TaxID=2719234 RepID=UPI0039E3A873